MEDRQGYRHSGSQYSGTGLILFQDCALSVLSSLLAILLVRWLSDPIPEFTSILLRWLSISLAASVLGALLSGSHKVVRRWATVRSSARLLTFVLIKEGMLLLVLLLGWVSFPSLALSVLAIMTDAMLTGFLLFYIRFAARVFSKSEVSRVKAVAARRNALVVGTGDASVSLARELMSEYNVVGFLTDDAGMEGCVISDIVVYYTDSLVNLETLDRHLGGVDCLFFPKGETMRLSGSEKNVREDRSTMSLVSQYVKRAFDVALSGFLLVVFSPLAMVCAIAVKLEDGGSVLFKQERLGRGGKPFYIYKFRSMREDAEINGAQLWSGDGDTRLTRVGGFLRRHHLDELPQLWNVFRGDMSFIGYRPERQCYIDEIMARNPRYSYLYQIRPGVTSYATLYNGYTDTLDKMLLRLDLDLYYLRNQSLLFDMKVLGLTFLSIISGKEF